MRFHPVADADSMNCFGSENDRWRVCLNVTVMGAIRINLWPFAEDAASYTKTYCCGHDRFLIAITLGAVMRIMEGLPESITVAEMDDRMPDHTVQEGSW